MEEQRTRRGALPSKGMYHRPSFTEENNLLSTDRGRRMLLGLPPGHSTTVVGTPRFIASANKRYVTASRWQANLPLSRGAGQAQKKITRR